MAQLNKSSCAWGCLLDPDCPPRQPWVGKDPAWQIALEHDAKRLYPGQVTSSLACDLEHPERPWVLTYRHSGLRVDGLVKRVPVEVQFHELPRHDTYGLNPVDYPLVFADPGAKSKHRHGNDALCLWYPRDWRWRTWRHTDGLGYLFQLTADHLLREAWWRATGADEHNSEWLGAEAAHGFPEDAEYGRAG